MIYCVNSIYLYGNFSERCVSTVALCIRITLSFQWWSRKGCSPRFMLVKIIIQFLKPITSYHGDYIVSLVHWIFTCLELWLEETLVHSSYFWYRLNCLHRYFGILFKLHLINCWLIIWCIVAWWLVILVIPTWTRNRIICWNVIVYLRSCWKNWLKLFVIFVYDLVHLL